MKKIITLLILTISFANLYAQVPQKISYQAVVRDATGKLVALKPVGVRISLLQGSEFGAAVYVETHSATTNLNALFSINIGGGTAVLGIFEGINWRNGPYFLKTEIDPLGGTSYSITGTQQLLSVPYAISTDWASSSATSDSANYANTAGKAMVADSLNQDAKIWTQQLRGGAAATDQYLRWDGNNWVPSTIIQLQAGNGIEVANGKIGTQWSSGVSGPYTDSLSVGIGTRDPSAKLHVSGNNFNVIKSNFEGQGWNSFYRYNRYLGYLGNWSDSNALDFGGSASGVHTNIVTNALPRISVRAGTGYVGINTTNPSTVLDVNGTTTTSNLNVTGTTTTPTLNVSGTTTTANLRVTSNAGTGKVMTSDASGNAIWTTPAKQIVGVYPANGFVGGGPYTSHTGYVFIGPTVSITVTSTGDIITGSFQVPLATGTGIATGCRFGLGYQLGAGTITNFTGGAFSIVSIGTERHSHAATASVTGLAAGTYTVGVILWNAGTVAINSNDYMNGFFTLLR